MTTNTNTNTDIAYFIAGSARIPGTNLDSNVTGSCSHRHRTAAAAQACIDATDRSIKRGHGQYAYCDRVVVAVGRDGSRTVLS